MVVSKASAHTTMAPASARLATVSAARPRWTYASFAPSAAVTGRRSARAVLAARDARCVPERTGWSATTGGRRPARHAGSAQASATAASTISSTTAARAGPGGPGCGVPSRASVSPSSGGASRRPPSSPTGAASRATVR